MDNPQYMQAMTEIAGQLSQLAQQLTELTAQAGQPQEGAPGAEAGYDEQVAAALGGGAPA